MLVTKGRIHPATVILRSENQAEHHIRALGVLVLAGPLASGRGGCALSLEIMMQVLPLLSAVVLYAVAAVRAGSDRLKTRTESFFFLGFFFAATYALCDYLSLTAPDGAAALLAAKLALTFLSLSVLCFLLFTTSLFTGSRRSILALVIPSVVLLASVWLGAVQDVKRTPWGWQEVFKPEILAFWGLYVTAYSIGGNRNIFKAFRITRIQDRSLALRTFAVLASFVFVLGAWLATELIPSALGIETVPVYSSLLLVPGLVCLLVVLPVTYDQFMGAIRAWNRGRCEVTGAFFMRNDGTLLESVTSSSESNIDYGSLSATLEVIRSFVQVSLGTQPGAHLRAVGDDEVRIVVERGKNLCLALTLKGEENDLLRREMRDAVDIAESRNLAGLSRGLHPQRRRPELTKALDAFFVRETLF